MTKLTELLAAAVTILGFPFVWLWFKFTNSGPKGSGFGNTFVVVILSFRVGLVVLGLLALSVIFGICFAVFS